MGTQESKETGINCTCTRTEPDKSSLWVGQCIAQYLVRRRELGHSSEQMIDYLRQKEEKKQAEGEPKRKKMVN